MSALEEITAGTRGRRAVVIMLQAAEIDAVSDPGAFFPQPYGVLVGLPTLAGRGLFSRTYTIPVTVVSGDPLNSELASDRLIQLADQCALALASDSYRPTAWRSSVNAEPLPAFEVLATVTVTELEEE